MATQSSQPGQYPSRLSLGGGVTGHPLVEATPLHPA